jgi:hypothetical protein
MRTAAALAALVCMGVVGAWSTDRIADGAPSYFAAAAPAPAATDGNLELKWDNGTRRWSWIWYTGADAWVGNDFDLSTISGYKAISKFKFYTRGAWPNGRWDGVRLAVYSFSTVPGSMLWPTSGGGYFFKPSAGIQAHIWVECDINWTCPSVKFLAAEEQFYNHPNCDPYAVDNNTVFMRHSWHYYQGPWEPASYREPYEAYRNVMLRVFVDDETVNVSPTSVGRVKALYY